MSNTAHNRRVAALKVMADHERSEGLPTGGYREEDRGETIALVSSAGPSEFTISYTKEPA